MTFRSSKGFNGFVMVKDKGIYCITKAGSYSEFNSSATDQDPLAFWKYILYSIDEVKQGSVANTFSWLKPLHPITTPSWAITGMKFDSTIICLRHLGYIGEKDINQVDTVLLTGR